MGKNKPHRNNIGNLKKFENVCASKISLAETAIINPSSVEVTAIKNTARNTAPQLMPERSMKNAAKITGTNALNNPNNIAPDSFAITNVLKEMGASSNRSKDLPLRSNVLVTASIEVVPNNTLMPIRPGSSCFISEIFTLPVVRISCISVHDSGKMMPQLMLGGLR